MVDQRIDRRTIFKGVGALGAAGTLAALHAPLAHADLNQADRDHGTRSIEGAWHVTASDGSNLLWGFAAGGVLVRTMAGEPAGDFPSGPAIGAWRTDDADDQVFIGTYVILFSDPKGTFTGTGTVRIRVALDKEGNTISGTFAFDFVFPNPSTPGFGNTGTFQGVRIVAAAPS